MLQVHPKEKSKFLIGGAFNLWSFNFILDHVIESLKLLQRRDVILLVPLVWDGIPAEVQAGK
jgi:hypothetical protein